MDTSEQYIKMCKEAEEIQGLMPKIIGSPYSYEIKEGDLGSFYFINGNTEILHHDNDTGMAMIGSYGDEEDERVWLPRQDQLQEMAKEVTLPDPWGILRTTHYGISAILTDFYNYFEWLMDYDYETVKDYSMEQLWLGFVMKEKYGKVWSNGKWIKKALLLSCML